GRQGALRLVVDEHREGDDPHPVTHLVDRVGQRKPPEKRHSQGLCQGALTHSWDWLLPDFCTSFLADAQVLHQLCYKKRSCCTGSRERASAWVSVAADFSKQ